MQLFIGLISGTSADAVDAALVSFFDKTIKLEHFIAKPYPSEVTNQITSMRSPEATFSLNTIASFNIQLGECFAAAATELMRAAKLKKHQVSAIGSHGQTIFHSPKSTPSFSLQFGDPNTIANLTGITTVADFRSMDIAAGGQGAPLVPPFHEALFRSSQSTKAVLNLGGIANITLLPASTARDIIGFDTGPANCLMDDWIFQNSGQPYDKNGSWGEQGKVIHALLSDMLNDDYFSQPYPKSTGREYFNTAWLDSKLQHGNYRAEDVQTTLQHLTAQSVAKSILDLNSDVDELIICGGGAKNLQVVALLDKYLPKTSIKSTADYHVDPDYLEAMAFAWLAKRRLENLPGNLPSVTGAEKEVILGGVYG